MSLGLVARTLLLSVATIAGPAEPHVRVLRGGARLAFEDGTRALSPRDGSVHLPSSRGWLESGAGTRLEFAWRGLASATLEGPLALECLAAPGLHLARFHTAEIEVRRGPFEIVLEGLGELELSNGALQLRALQGGRLELTNRGGNPLTVTRAGQGPVEIAPGARRRFQPDG